MFQIVLVCAEKREMEKKCRQKFPLQKPPLEKIPFLVVFLSAMKASSSDKKKPCHLVRGAAKKKVVARMAFSGNLN